MNASWVDQRRSNFKSLSVYFYCSCTYMIFFGFGVGRHSHSILATHIGINHIWNQFLLKILHNHSVSLEKDDESIITRDSTP